MSDVNVLLIRTALFTEQPALPLPEGLQNSADVIEMNVDSATTAEQWDQVLRSLLDRDRCITL